MHAWPHFTLYRGSSSPLACLLVAFEILSSSSPRLKPNTAKRKVIALRISISDCEDLIFVGN